MGEGTPNNDTVNISSRWFLAGCAATALAVLFIGRTVTFPAWIIATEVLITIISLFVFGSTRYALDKNALTYGAVMIIGATFTTGWRPQSSPAELFQHYFLTLHGLDQLFHADTMLFILGLTFFVAVIAQTRLLETVSFVVLKKTKGQVFTTIAILTAIVSTASGILDGVSMIGLMIRTMVIILFLSKAKEEAVLFSVIISTVVTTVCGMWLAYGEPPNLIMKANLEPHLTNSFFLRYCLPVAFGSYLIVYFNLRRLLGKQQVSLKSLDILDLHTADARFLQASRRGKVFTPIEFIENNQALLGSHHAAILHRIKKGEPLGEALVDEQVPKEKRLDMLGDYLARELAETLDDHYVRLAKSPIKEAGESLPKVQKALDRIRQQRVRSQWIGGLSFVPFIGLLIWHAIDHRVSLFWASFAGFAIALTGIFGIPKMRKLALREAAHEYREYLFLFPLFFSITLLQKSGFFDQMSALLHQGVEQLGLVVMALIQFTGAVFLSALLDNNVVADFAGRALRELDLHVLHLFAMAQIAGYAAGGCWTHIGSAQSVVAYSFIKKEINPRYTPFKWIKCMTPVIIEISILMVVIIYAEAYLAKMLHW